MLLTPSGITAPRQVRPNHTTTSPGLARLSLLSGLTRPWLPQCSLRRAGQDLRRSPLRALHPELPWSRPGSPGRIASGKRPMNLTHEEQLAAQTPINSGSSEATADTRLQIASTATSPSTSVSPRLGMPPNMALALPTSTVSSPSGAKSAKVEGRACFTSRPGLFFEDDEFAVRALASSRPSISDPLGTP
jgi:hypothetical protein